MGCCESTCRKPKPDFRVNEVETHNPLNKVDKNLMKVCRSVCHIEVQNQYGTGFFIKLLKNNKEIFYLLTNEHVINNKFIESNQIIYLNYDCDKYNIIKLNKSERFIKFYEDMDVTIIEIIKSDNIDANYFLEPNYDKILIGQEIYIWQFPKRELSYSYGHITQINNFELTHNASTDFGSSGSPIFLKDSITVIGIHKQGNYDKKENYGTLINPLIKRLQDENNNNTNNGNYNYKNRHLNNNLSKGKAVDENITNIKNIDNENIEKLVNEKGEIYVGPAKNKLPDGKGKLYNKNGELIYEGYFVKGIQEGKGRKITKNEYYNGNFIEGKMYGEGEIYFKDGNMKYIGEFVNDKKEGKGKYFFSNREFFFIENRKKFYLEKGDYYIGHWLNDTMNGKGKIYLNDGRIKYEGDFVNNKFQGHGKYMFESGKYYIGQFFNDMQHGKGEIYDKNDKLLFKGDFINDHIEGSGTLYFKDGSYLVGHFIKGEIQGKGKIYLKDGNVFECQFVDGEIWNIEKKNKKNFDNYFSEIMNSKMYSKRKI